MYVLREVRLFPISTITYCAVSFEIYSRSTFVSVSDKENIGRKTVPNESSWIFCCCHRKRYCVVVIYYVSFLPFIWYDHFPNLASRCYFTYVYHFGRMSQAVSSMYYTQWFFLANPCIAMQHAWWDPMHRY